MKFQYILTTTFIIFSGNFVYVTKDTQQTRKLSRVDRIEVCDIYSNSALKLNEININNFEGENVFVNINATLVRELRHEVRFKVFITRCLSKEALDTCVPFTTLKPINTCALIAMGNMAWSELVDEIKPSVRCPFKTGHYTITNDTLDAGKFAFFPIDNYYWKTKFVMIEDKIDWITNCADMRAINVHN